jgi:hypothetical protein
MNRGEAMTSTLGIGHARTHLMKNLHPVLPSDREPLGYTAIQAAERPIKICVVFEDDVSAGSVEVFIKNSSVPATISISDLNSHN